MPVAFSLSEADDRVGFVTFDKPPANSYDHDLMRELDAALDEVAAHGTVRVVIVRSAIARFFCAGADIKAFSEHTPAENMEMIRFAHGVLGRLTTMPRLFIAQVGGHALGGGLEIALACDLRFAAEGAYRVGLPEVTLGLLPGNGGTQRLPRLIGWSRALDLMVTGRTLSPGEAHLAGIFEALYPAERLEDETLEYASSVARGAWLAVTAIKRSVREGTTLPAPEGLALEQDLMATLFESHDGHEGLRAVVEKRPPDVKGR
ncbi:MAG: enoyl-CoA hydratase/isomerase family protein [Actinomycetota bacterium]